MLKRIREGRRAVQIVMDEALDLLQRKGQAQSQDEDDVDFVAFVQSTVRRLRGLLAGQYIQLPDNDCADDDNAASVRERLEEALADLRRDEIIFAEKRAQLQRLRNDLETTHSDREELRQRVVQLEEENAELMKRYTKLKKRRISPVDDALHVKSSEWKHAHDDSIFSDHDWILDELDAKTKASPETLSAVSKDDLLQLLAKEREANKMRAATEVEMARKEADHHAKQGEYEETVQNLKTDIRMKEHLIKSLIEKEAEAATAMQRDISRLQAELKTAKHDLVRASKLEGELEKLREEHKRQKRAMEVSKAGFKSEMKTVLGELDAMQRQRGRIIEEQCLAEENFELERKANEAKLQQLQDEAAHRQRRIEALEAENAKLGIKSSVGLSRDRERQRRRNLRKVDDQINSGARTPVEAVDEVLRSLSQLGIDVSSSIQKQSSASMDEWEHLSTWFDGRIDALANAGHAKSRIQMEKKRVEEMKQLKVDVEFADQR